MHIAHPSPVSSSRALSTMKPEQVTVASGSSLQGHQWTGSDSQRSRLDGLAVLGRSIQSDTDTGAIALRLKRGDRFLYHSGPGLPHSDEMP